MKKCTKCGTVFEGNVCPNCGFVGEGRKRCPKCGAIVSSASKFCNGCGFSFENGTPSTRAKKSSAAAVWVKKHKVAIIISSIVLVVAIVLLSLIPTFIKASVNGTYYAYDAIEDKLDPKDYIMLKTGNWSDSDGLSGTYKVNGKAVTMIADFFGDETEFATVTVDNGMLTIEEGGQKSVYLSKKHKHSYGGWAEKDKLTCTQNETRSRFCGCGKEEVEIVTEAQGHQGDWITTREVSCTDYGIQQTHCTVCDQDVEKYIEKLPHDLHLKIAETQHYNECSMCQQIFDAENHTDTDECLVCHFPKSYTKELVFELNDDGTGYTVTGINDTNIKLVRIPEKYQNLPVTAIGNEAFKQCYIEYIYIPNGVTSIGWAAFKDCTSLTSITIPDSVTIESYAFRFCYRLTSITIPDGVTIESHAFDGCRGLTITIPDSVTLGPLAFLNCSGRILYTGDMASWCSNNELYRLNNGIYINNQKLTEMTSITIPDGVTSIRMYAFGDCTSLTNIIISDSVTSIEEYAFFDCSGLTNITFTGTKAQWQTIEKYGDWDYKTGNYIVQCTDGKLNKKGN